jgi:transposase-like protein
MDTPREFLNIVRQLIEIVEQGKFLLVHADCPLQDFFNTTWPGDVITHRFQCTECGRVFERYTDTYHGGARWWPN